MNNKNNPVNQRVYIPSLKDIKRACRDINKSWSPQEREKRMVSADLQNYTIPSIHTCDLVGAYEDISLGKGPDYINSY